MNRPFELHSVAPRHLLHPELALLLSTSGSTGSPKLVRLSARNLRSNAEAIARALQLTAADRAVTSLPLHYCFGLSVLHSHLVAGGSVLLHEGSVVEPSLWEAIDGRQVTTLAVVPHMVELMESTGVLERPHPSLRLLAQAGGRMSPGRVQRTVDLGREGGWELAVMYGQTEATARICVLDPALVAQNPDAVGHPVAGTSLHLDTSVPEAQAGSGEVLVRGPGVMMGYAEHPDDLALGAMHSELRTGDLGRIGPDGLLRLVGRRSGFVKVMGVRIDVAVVENALESAGYTGCVGADGAVLAVAVEPLPGRDAAEVAAGARAVAVRASGLGPAAVALAVATLPRLPNGKVDRPGCAALVSGTGSAPGTGMQGGEKSPVARIAGTIGAVLGIEAVDPGRSFVQHGGDSLSHVQASLKLESFLGPLPRGWHHRPLAELAGLPRREPFPVAPGSAGSPGDGPGPAARRGVRARLRFRSVESTVVLRALAVVAICGSHAQLFDLLGGAHILLAVAGYNTVRFGLAVPGITARWRAAARMLLGVAVPTMAVALFGMLATQRYGWSNVLLGHWLFGHPVAGSTRNEYWFIDALAAGIVVLAAVLSVPAVSRAWARDPWRVAAVLTALALVPRFAVPALTQGPMEQSIMPTVFWLVAAGAAAAYAGTRGRRWATFALAVLGGATFFPGDPQHCATVLAGVAVLLFIQRLPVPAAALPLLSLLASASLYIYLVQFLVLSMFENDVVETIAALAAGTLLWLVADRPVRHLQDALIPMRGR
nr:AMP-binding protein [Paeniglutamicibacter psychrophenolicus]